MGATRAGVGDLPVAMWPPRKGCRLQARANTEHHHNDDIEEDTTMTKYNDKHAMQTYHISNDEAKLAQAVYDHRNTREGEEMLRQLETRLQGRDNSILYDLAADFRWDYEWEEA